MRAAVLGRKMVIDRLVPFLRAEGVEVVSPPMLQQVEGTGPVSKNRKAISS